jgi:hypothetical protein
MGKIMYTGLKKQDKVTWRQTHLNKVIIFLVKCDRLAHTLCNMTLLAMEMTVLVSIHRHRTMSHLQLASQEHR